MLATSRIAASAFLALGLVTACSSSTESTAAGSVDVQAFASAQCDYVVRCQPYLLESTFGTKDGCVAAITSVVTPELTLKGVSISQAQATACEGQQGTQACDDTSTPTECRFKGTLANDAPCAVDLQCSSGNCYFSTNASGTSGTCGTCKPYAAEGASCADAVCEPGLSCNTAGTCIKGVAEGAACTDAFDCDGILQCVAGKCTKLFPEGTACKPLDTTAGVCDRRLNLYCKPTIADGSAGACAKYAFAAVGATCGVDVATFQVTTCTASQCVVPTADAVSGTCTALVAAGGACTAGSVPCSSGLACTGGVCTAPDLASCNP